MMSSHKLVGIPILHTNTLVVHAHIVSPFRLLYLKHRAVSLIFGDSNTKYSPLTIRYKSRAQVLRIYLIEQVYLIISTTNASTILHT